MGLTKTEIFTDEQNSLATMIKALAHPARIAILQHLFTTKYQDIPNIFGFICQPPFRSNSLIPIWNFLKREPL